MSVTPVSQLNVITSQSKMPKENKRKILACAGVGTAVAYGIIAHRQGFKLSKLTQTPVKDWAIFSLKEQKAVKIEEHEVFGLAGGSVVGGLAGGAVFDDKKNFKAKLRESLSQMVGNVGIPILCVGQATRFYKRHEEGIEKSLPTFKNETSALKKYTNRAIKAIPPVGVTGVALATGIFAGNKVSNFINEKISGKKISREIRGTDFAPHVDDVCLGITLMAPGTAIGQVISKTVPFFLTVPGYETGMAQEDS